MSLFHYCRAAAVGRTVRTARTVRILDAMRAKHAAALVSIHAVPNVETARQRADRRLFGQ